MKQVQSIYKDLIGLMPELLFALIVVASIDVPYWSDDFWIDLDDLQSVLPSVVLVFSASVVFLKVMVNITTVLYKQTETKTFYICSFYLCRMIFLEIGYSR
jgi:hypothetical protein